MSEKSSCSISEDHEDIVDQGTVGGAWNTQLTMFMTKARVRRFHFNMRFFPWAIATIFRKHHFRKPGPLPVSRLNAQWRGCRALCVFSCLQLPVLSSGRSWWHFVLEYFFLKIKFIINELFCVYAFARWQLVGLGSLLPLCGFQESNSDQQAWTSRSHPALQSKILPLSPHRGDS